MLYRNDGDAGLGLWNWALDYAGPQGTSGTSRPGTPGPDGVVKTCWGAGALRVCNTGWWGDKPPEQSPVRGMKKKKHEPPTTVDCLRVQLRFTVITLCCAENLDWTNGACWDVKPEKQI